MPPLKMGKTIADKLKGPQGTPTSLDTQKPLKIFH
jgi:hypothetical protein